MTRVDPRVQRTHDNVLAAAARLLLDRGWNHVTHANVAAEAGYARATLYAHWPAPADLLRAAFLHIGGMDHGMLTGDLREDLVEELEAWRKVLQTQRMSTALVALADRASTDPVLAEVRDQFLGEGQAQARSLVSQCIEAGLIRAGAPVGPVTDMLSGALVYRIAIHGEQVGRDYVEAVVDTLLGTTDAR